LAYVFKYVLRSGIKICEKILQKSNFSNFGIGSFMKIGVLGINYKSAKIAVREWVSKACRTSIPRDGEIAEGLHAVLLSTCNRCEIYFSCDHLAGAHSVLLNLLRREIETAFEQHLYSFFGVDCFAHLAKVTSGLDSVIVAESEIQRQVKMAYEQTLLYYSLPSCMHFLFQKSLKLGKQIRSSFALSQNQVTIPKILFQLSARFIDLPVLFIGNSEINRKVITYFHRQGMRNMALCTRSLLSAKEIAEKENLALVPWDMLSSWQEYPLVICGSNAPHYLVDYPHGPSCKTQLIFDLSVPRNVDPLLSRSPQLVLLNMQQISAMLESRQEKNLQEISRAEDLILECVHRYHHSYCEKEKRTLTCI
jgi:glutamyl-tRNA reductase